MALGFWVSGQFLLTRAYTLLVFAGVWPRRRPAGQRVDGVKCR